MVGHLVLRPDRRPGVAAGLERVGGCALLRAAVAAPAGAREKLLARRVDKAARILAGEGVRRVLAPAGLPWWDRLGAWGLSPIDPGPLARHMAAPLALAALERRGRTPARSVVELRGQRVDRAFYDAALALCPRVRALEVRAASGGVELAGLLRREFGVPILERGAAPDLTVSFSPRAGPPGLAELTLWGPAPGLLGLKLDAGEEYPLDPGEKLPFLTVLWEEGRLSGEALRVI